MSAGVPCSDSPSAKNEAFLSLKDVVIELVSVLAPCCKAVSVYLHEDFVFFQEALIVNNANQHCGVWDHNSGFLLEVEKLGKLNGVKETTEDRIVLDFIACEDGVLENGLKPRAGSKVELHSLADL